FDKGRLAVFKAGRDLGENYIAILEVRVSLLDLTPWTLIETQLVSKVGWRMGHGHKSGDGFIVECLLEIQVSQVTNARFGPASRQLATHSPAPTPNPITSASMRFCCSASSPAPSACISASSSRSASVSSAI